MSSPIKNGIYQPLLDDKSIRLLTVHEANRKTSSIECSLDIVSLHDVPDYAALPYTWGGEAIDHNVIVSGFNFKVTQSCHRALSTFRDQWMTTPVVPESFSPTERFHRFRRRGRCVLWVDQLCINQVDFEERAQQILLMRFIYSKASTVWLWTEPLSHESAPSLRKGGKLPGAADLIPEQRIINLVEHFGLLGERRNRGDGGYLEGIPKEVVSSAAWHSLFSLLTRRYFTRRWTIPEYSANENTFLSLQGYLVDLGLLKTTSLHYPELYERADERQNPEVFDVLQRWNNIQFPLIGVTTLRVWQAGPKAVVWRFLTLLMNVGRESVSRDEDIFFALRPFAPKASVLPKPVYGASTVTLHLQHVAAFFEMGMSASMLQLSGICQRGIPGLPSWCPDFYHAFTNTSLTKTKVLSALGPESETLVALRPELTKYYQLSKSNPSVLRAAVSFECKLKHVCYVNDFTGRTLDVAVSESLEFASSLRAHIATPNSQAFTAFSNFIQSTLGGLDRNDERLQENHWGNIFAKWSVAMQAFLAPIYPRVFLDAPFRDRLRESCIDFAFRGTVPVLYKLAITDNGLLCLVSVFAFEDDDVVLFPGCWLPNIIRRKEGTENYEIVGDAFVYGLKGKEYELQLGANAKSDWAEMALQLRDEELRQITLE